MGSGSEQAAKLRGVAPHDAKRWGPLRAATEGRPRLVRLLDLIQAAAAADELALPAAAGLVATRLNGGALFLLDPKGDAQPVTDASEFVNVRPLSFEVAWDRPRPLDIGITYFRGARGLLQWMRKNWIEQPGSGKRGSQIGDDWDDDEGACAAMLQRDALALFPELFELAESRPAPHAEPSTRQATQAAALEAAAPPPDFTCGKAWTDRHRLAFLAAYKALIAAGMGKESALSELAAKGWAKAGPTLQKRIVEGGEARKREERKGVRLHAA